jgi:hypothetical protein
MDRQTYHVDTSCEWLRICHFYVKRVPYSTLGTFFTFCCRHFLRIIHFSISTPSATSKISTMVDLEGPLLHSVAASLHKVSNCTADCRLLLALAALIVFVVFQHCHWSHCSHSSHLWKHMVGANRIWCPESSFPVRHPVFSQTSE